MSISFTIDLEDPTARYEREGRYAILARRLLDLCDEVGCRATFFTVGRIAENTPELIQDIAARGHEIAYHTYNHVPLTEENPMRFRREAALDKDKLEQLAGKSVFGFRAPRFSLTPKNTWTLDALKDLGFLYSSSIMPTGASLYGFQSAPRHKFLWPNGLVEFPLPVAKVGPWHIPYLGGIYLYALPSKLTQKFIAKAGPDEILWTYTHPYDFDREEKYTGMPHTPAWISMVLWASRRMAENKIRKALAAGIAPPLGERL